MNNDNSKPTTTDAGIPVASDEYSLTVGPDGPILLQDHYLIEQMANFNRERIAERQPHAKGSGAFGYFEVTKDSVSRSARVNSMASFVGPATQLEAAKAMNRLIWRKRRRSSRPS